MAEAFPHRRTTNYKKIQYDLLRREIPLIIPFLWIPRSSRLEHLPKRDGGKVILRPWTGRPTDQHLYISNEIHIPSLLWDTAHILSQLIKCSGVVIYLVDHAMNELYVNAFEDDDHQNRVAWKIRSDSNTAAYVADQKKSVMLNNLKIVEPYNGYDWKGLTVSGTLAVPIVTSDNDSFAVIELYRRDGINFNKNHLSLTTTIGHWVAAAVEHNKNRAYVQIQQKIETYLLELTQYYLTNPTHIHLLMRDIVNFAKECLNSVRGEFFTVERGILHTESHTTSTDKCIAEYTLNLKTLINIEDAYNDPRFVQEDHLKNNRHITRTALCMPVFGRNNRILGILLIVNKLNGRYVAFDETLFQLFVKYCIIAIEYTKRYTSWIKREKWALIYDEVYFHQIINKRPERPIEEHMITDVDLPKDFYELTFYPSEEDNLVKLACCLLKTLRLTPLEIAKFVMCVRHSYRDIPYHNFEHAFNVLHSTVCILERNSEKFSYVEKAAFMISMICHDLDHRGFTNQFIETTDSPLITLYDESPMENHHFFMAMLIVQNTPFQKSMSSIDYKRMVSMIKEMILASDLTRHLNDRSQLSELCSEIHQKGEDVWRDNEELRSVVRGLMVTASDLSGQAKSFPIAQHLTKNIMMEFYAEGDRLKDLELKLPESMDVKFMNRIPQLQVQFLEIICLPCFDFLQIIFPNTSELYYSAKSLQNTWRDLARLRAEKNANLATGDGKH